MSLKLIYIYTCFVTEYSFTINCSSIIRRTSLGIIENSEYEEEIEIIFNMPSTRSRIANCIRMNEDGRSI